MESCKTINIKQKKKVLVNSQEARRCTTNDLSKLRQRQSKKAGEYPAQKIGKAERRM